MSFSQSKQIDDWHLIKNIALQQFFSLTITSYMYLFNVIVLEVCVIQNIIFRAFK